MNDKGCEWGRREVGLKRGKQIYSVISRTLKGRPGGPKEEVSTKHLKIPGL